MQSPQVLSRVVDTVFSAVRIRAVERSAVDPAMSLGRGGLGLDSVDILEIVVAIEHEFQLKIPSKTVGQQVFQSIGSIAQYVEANSPVFARAADAPLAAAPDGPSATA
jgi:acyl carrier protein